MSERSERAAIVFAALDALDVDAPQRAELAAAGVSKHRIESLYPHHFDSFAEGLLGYLRQTEVAHILDAADRIEERLEISEVPFKNLPPALHARFIAAQGHVGDGGAGQQLHAWLWQELPSSDKIKCLRVASNFCALLLRTWWAAAVREDLPPHLQVNSDLRLLGVARILPPELAPQGGGR